MTEETGSQSLPVCARNDDIEELDGERVVVHGVYEQVDVRKRAPGDDSEPVYRGHVVLRFGDGYSVFLEPTWSEEGVRADEEIASFEGREVRAVGILHRYCPTPPEPVAAIISPCLTPVERVFEP